MKKKASNAERKELFPCPNASSGSAFFIEMTGLEKKKGPSIIDETQHASFQRNTGCDDDTKAEFDNLIPDEQDKFENVLVVEDSKLNQKMMIKALSKHAKNIVLAGDGVVAVNTVRESLTRNAVPFDVIFMDSFMPNMNGIDATKIILRELKFPNPIIAVTGNMLPEDVQEFKDAGAWDVLGKPLMLDELAKVLKCELWNNSYSIYICSTLISFVGIPREQV